MSAFGTFLLMHLMLRRQRVQILGTSFEQEESTILSLALLALNCISICAGHPWKTRCLNFEDWSILAHSEWFQLASVFCHSVKFPEINKTKDSALPRKLFVLDFVFTFHFSSSQFFSQHQS